MRLKSAFASRADAVQAGGYKFVTGPIKKPTDVKAPLRVVNDDVEIKELTEDITIGQALEIFHDMEDLSAHEALGAANVDDPDGSPVVVAWRGEDGKVWLANRSNIPKFRALFVGTREETDILPQGCRILVGKRAEAA